MIVLLHVMQMGFLHYYYIIVTHCYVIITQTSIIIHYYPFQTPKLADVPLVTANVAVLSTHTMVLSMYVG